jgi:hypothetical protein
MKKPSEIILDLMKLQNKSVNQVIQCMEIDRLTFHKLISDNLIFSDDICLALKETFGHREYYWKTLYENFVNSNGII